MISRAPFTPESVKGEMAVLKRGLEIFSLALKARRHAAPAFATCGLFFNFSICFFIGELPFSCKTGSLLPFYGLVFKCTIAQVQF